MSERKKMTVQDLKTLQGRLEIPPIKEGGVGCSVSGWKLAREDLYAFAQWTDEEIDAANEEGFIGIKAGVKCWII